MNYLEEFQLLRDCAPDEELADQWVKDFADQNNLLREEGEEPLLATEFIQCRVDDLYEEIDRLRACAVPILPIDPVADALVTSLVTARTGRSRKRRL